MKVLFIGGTGIISTAVSKVVVEKNIDLYVLNRGNHNTVLPEKVHLLQGDIYDVPMMKDLLKDKFFDVVVQWISFTVEHVKRDVELFKNHTKQYVFISSASAYKKPLPFIPITEEMPLDNPYWEYSQNKKRCEEYLLASQTKDFHVTIIRPSHTYNETMLVSQLKSWAHPYTMINRMLNNKPIVLIDDGMAMWTLTYNMDFAKGFVDVLGNEKTYGEFYHLTSDKAYTWERINELICEAVGVKPNIIYIPIDFVLEHFPEFKPEIIGDKYQTAIFDNTKIKQVAPNYTSETDYGDIVKMAVERLKKDTSLQTIDEEFDRRYDLLIERYKEKGHH